MGSTATIIQNHHCSLIQPRHTSHEISEPLHLLVQRANELGNETLTNEHLAQLGITNPNQTLEGLSRLAASLQRENDIQYNSLNETEVNITDLGMRVGSLLPNQEAVTQRLNQKNEEVHALSRECQELATQYHILQERVDAIQENTQKRQTETHNLSTSQNSSQVLREIGTQVHSINTSINQSIEAEKRITEKYEAVLQQLQHTERKKDESLEIIDELKRDFTKSEEQLKDIKDLNEKNESLINRLYAPNENEKIFEENLNEQSFDTFVIPSPSTDQDVVKAEENYDPNVVVKEASGNCLVYFFQKFHEFFSRILNFIFCRCIPVVVYRDVTPIEINRTTS